MELEDYLSWLQGFSEPMYSDDRRLFEKMIADFRASDLAKLDSGKEPSERLFMTLIFQQQKIINCLMRKVKELEDK